MRTRTKKTTTAPTTHACESVYVEARWERTEKKMINVEEFVLVAFKDLCDQVKRTKFEHTNIELWKKCYSLALLNRHWRITEERIATEIDENFQSPFFKLFNAKMELKWLQTLFNTFQSWTGLSFGANLPLDTYTLLIFSVFYFFLTVIPIMYDFSFDIFFSVMIFLFIWKMEKCGRTSESNWVCMCMIAKLETAQTMF